MNPTEDNHDHLQHVDNPLNVMSPGERVICHIKRHPIGLLGVYFATAFLIVAIFAGVGAVGHYAASLTSQDKAYIFIAAIALMVVALLYMYIAVTVYKGNRWIVTSDSITQITQTGLFQKQSSQLSLENLEDVTFEQSSFLQTMVGFGTLHVETAGEHSKFVFPFCPNPNKCAKEIIQAHEDFIIAHAPQAHDVQMPQQFQQPQYMPPTSQPLPPAQPPTDQTWQ